MSKTCRFQHAKPACYANLVEFLFRSGIFKNCFSKNYNKDLH